MHVVAAIGLMLLFAIGALLGLVIGPVVAAVSFYRGARAVHAHGVLCRAEVIIHGYGRVHGPRAGNDPTPALAALAGPALVRLSGAFNAQAATASDVLGLDLRLQRAPSDDARQGDQDLLFGSFESFATAGRDRARTNTGDYLANHYSTVTPWWLAGHGPVILRLVPPPAAPAAPADRAGDRLARLDADLAANRARLALALGTADHVIGELRLIARVAADDRGLRASMFRQGRGVRPLGLRNGIRATVYPMSQAARRLRRG
jgi:hypothetical protein